MSAGENIKEELLICPLTHAKFVDPVIDHEGNSYERSAIEEWLKTHRTSPVTRSRLQSSDLRPNRILRQIIEQSERKKLEKLKPKPKITHAPSRLIVQDGQNSRGKQKYITIIPDQKGSRCPVHVVIVIDVSGSMGNAADVPGSGESSGLTTLDVVKHAAKTVIHMLGDNDRCSVVTFSSTAALICDGLLMNKAGKALATNKLTHLEPLYSTNLWEGLHTALKTLVSSEQKQIHYFNSIFLLTDGMPNIKPNRSHVCMLERFQNKNSSTRKISISTFGFGYDLDTVLLKDLAMRGQGHYAFIPDPGMVGTVFVHALSNLLTTAGQHAKLLLSPTDLNERANSFGNLNQKATSFYQRESIPSWIKKIYGIYDCTSSHTSKDEVLIDVGSIHFGQPRTFIVDLVDDQNDFFVSMSYTAVDGDVSTVMPEQSGKHKLSRDAITQNKLRLLSVEALEAASTTIDVSNDYSAAQNIIANMIDQFRQHRQRKSGLALDLAGEVTLAVSSENNFKKWGVHYLPSLGLSHLLQVCSNFKDAGMQEYSKGDLFQQIRDEADDLFVGLPPPLPSRKMSIPSTLSSMSRYHNAAGPCFAGHCRVSMADGSFLPIELLRKGDCVICPSSGEVATVACIIATRCQNSQCGMVRLPGTKLDVTPYHPIRLNGKWTFPINVAGAIFETLTNCEVIYSFILENPTVHVSLKIEGMECLGLAHQIIGDPVASHPFFGTNRVIDDLRPLGYESGLVTFDSDCVVRGDDGNMRQVVTSFDSSRLLPSQKIIF